MNSYLFKAYWKYWKKAKGRHGVHSPFVFSFIENILRKKTKTAPNFNLAIKQSNSLINKIVSHFQCKQILWLSNNLYDEQSYISISDVKEKKATVTSKQCNWESLHQFPIPDLVLINTKDPQEWQPIFEKMKTVIHPNTIVILVSIHQSEWHTKNWNQIAKQEYVKLSIDLFKIGLLLFRDEFLAKQHFVLK